VWLALQRAHLSRHIEKLPAGLDATVEEGGKNFSLGERQLLCMARSVDKHPFVRLFLLNAHVFRSTIGRSPCPVLLHTLTPHNPPTPQRPLLYPQGASPPLEDPAFG
jgi:hypothetical protein